MLRAREGDGTRYMIEQTLSDTGYLVAAATFAVVAIMLVALWRDRLPSPWLPAALVGSAGWAASLALLPVAPDSLHRLLPLVEFLHDGLWLYFLASLLQGAVAARWLNRLRKGTIAIAVLLPCLAVAWGLAPAHAAPYGPPLLEFGSVLTALAALLLLEQIFRNSREQQRQSLKFMCVGVAVPFVSDLVLYLHAIGAGQPSADLWSVRGFISAMGAPLVAIAAYRHIAPRPGLFLSRQMVFFTTTLVAASIYALAVVAIFYSIDALGGSVATGIQIVFLFAALLLLLVLAGSRQLRARIRVFVAKHFFEHKYDYRGEWLRLIETLTSHEDSTPLRRRAVKALTEIVNSPSGQLWLAHGDRGVFSCYAGWNSGTVSGALSHSDPMVSFLRKTGWVIDLIELRLHGDKYEGLDTTDISPLVADMAIVVPLLQERELIGFIAMAAPDAPTSLNYEDYDLLKTAGKQVASYISQEIATELLTEHRQFEAFNRLTAFIMHDMKNVVAQQALVVENAQKHKTNPEFVDDAIETVRNGVMRMRRVIDHLQNTTTDRPVENVELGKIAMQAVSQCAHRLPVPRVKLADTQLRVRADRERLLMAVVHAIRNAQDATDDGGQIMVETEETGRHCTLTVIDNGSGMEQEFVRDFLFRPFFSTKGTQGMGIGMYQIRETVRAAGGTISIDTQPGKGTRLSMVFPLNAMRDAMG